MIELKVPDMTCGHCVASVTRAVRQADPAARVEIVLAEKRVGVESSLSREELQALLQKAGYAAFA